MEKVDSDLMGTEVILDLINVDELLIGTLNCVYEKSRLAAGMNKLKICR